MRLTGNKSQAVDTLVHHDVSTPDGLAFDWIHKNLYWTDTGNNRIDVLSLSSAAEGQAMRKTLFDVRLDEPRAIVVDPRDDQRQVEMFLGFYCRCIQLCSFHYLISNFFILNFLYSMYLLSTISKSR